jgi:tetratricopeptide (TPR) repeat protein
VQLHSRFADWMAELDSASDLVELEAFHLERACQLAGGLSMRSAEPPTQRAVGALIRASQRAEHRRGLREARSYAERALSLAPSDDERLAIGARLSLARSELWVGALDAADTDLRAVATEAAGLDLPETECEAHALLADVAMKQDRLADARDFLVRARQLAERFGDHPLRVLTAFEEASLGDYEGRFDEALDKLEAAIAVAASLDAVDLLSEGHLRRGMLLANCGRLVEADRELELCGEAALGTGSVHDDARAAFARAQVQHHLGQVESSEALALRAEAWFERTDTTNMRVQNLFLLARHARRRGDLQRAEDVLADAVALTDRAADWLQYEARRLLVEHLVLEGRMSEARELVRRVENDYDAEPRGYSAVAWTLTRAAIAFGDGDAALGRELCESALDSLAGMNLPADLSSARLGYARLLRLSGDVQAAREQVAHARAALADVDAPGLVTEVDDVDALLW